MNFKPALLGAALTLLASAVSAEESTDWKQGKWGHLAPHIGTYKYDEVLKDPAVSAELDALLGGERALFDKNLEVRTPIGFDEDCMILSGNARHEGGERGFAAVCLYGAKIHAGILSQGKATVYSRVQDYAHLPDSIKTWILVGDRTALAAPPDTLILKQPE